MDLCCLDMRPFDIVSGKGFHKVAQTLIDIGAKFGAVDTGAILLHRQTVCDRAKKQAVIDKQKLLDAIQRALNSNSGIAITTDMWTDEFKKRAYTVLTCHYISECKLVNRILATVEFDPTLKKTSENLHEPPYMPIDLKTTSGWQTGAVLKMCQKTVVQMDGGRMMRSVMQLWMK